VRARVRRLSVARQWNSYSDLIADRFRNPVVILTLLSFPVMSLEAYILAQHWAIRALIPVVSDGNMHEDRMTLLLTVVVYICESFGGFDAVSYADVIPGIGESTSRRVLIFTADGLWAGGPKLKMLM